ncbi:MAG: RHS repeat-associated core domain-containing protein [Candidatus Zixiibacteriota bacterium]|nr:MAG: RHS repeat-associated core domain-containing protein [candidate division Zixibacteria bacterium]
MVYDSYGVMTTDSGSVQADYVSYTGREAEADLGIYYYRARYYDPLTGRFMVRDPLGFAAGDVNFYRYIWNNPSNLRDPSGLFSGGIRAGGDHLGHSDFYGHQIFWYNLEDLDKFDSPWNIRTDPWYYPEGSKRHFRNIIDVERDLIAAIDAGDAVCVGRLLHQGQDYFTHYGKGYRYKKGGHVWDSIKGYFTGNDPDVDDEAWLRANAWTIWWVNQWVQSNGMQ